MANRWGKKQTKKPSMETVTDFIFLSSKIMADSDCSHEIKRYLLLGRNAMTNLDSIFKIRDITLPTKVCIVKAMVFSVVVQIWELDHKEGWVRKNWCFPCGCSKCTEFREESWKNHGWRRLSRVPWTAKRLNQSILKEINPEYSLILTDTEAEIPKLGQLMWRTYSLEKTFKLGKIEGRRRGWEKIR